MNEQKLYEILIKNIESTNYESYTDSYGNRIESFLLLDDCAITFVFNNNNKLVSAWKVD